LPAIDLTLIASDSPGTKFQNHASTYLCHCSFCRHKCIFCKHISI